MQTVHLTTILHTETQPKTSRYEARSGLVLSFFLQVTLPRPAEIVFNFQLAIQECFNSGVVTSAADTLSGTLTGPARLDGRHFEVC